MGTVLELLGRALLLLLQIDDVALVQRFAFVALVVLGQLARTDANLLAQLLESLSLTGVDVVVLVEIVDGVQCRIIGSDALRTRVSGYVAIVGLGTVILVEPVEFDDVDELVGILRVGGISGSFESVCPSAVVGLAQL